MTRLTSPAYDLSGMSEPHVFYYRWYFNAIDSEEFAVKMSTDGGSTFPIELERTDDFAPFWTPVVHDLTAYAGSLSSVSLRFIAKDPIPDSEIEVAIDDLTFFDAPRAPSRFPIA